MLRIAPNLSLPVDSVTQTFSIIAKRGVGKTHTAVVMVEEMLRAKQAVVVVDPVGVWWGLRSSKDGKGPGFPVVIFGGEHADVPIEEQSGEVIAGAIVAENFSALIDLSGLGVAAQTRFMTRFAETVYHKNRKPLHMVVDEADAFAPQRPMPGEARCLGAMENIVRRGRARGLGVTLITQRAAVLNKNVLTQTEVMIALRVIAPQDRAAIRAWIVAHATAKQEGAFMDSLATLEIGEAWVWSPGWLDIFKRVKVRDRETFDSSATPKVGGGKVTPPKQLAPVDIARLGEQIQRTAEQAKENDPAELKRQVAALKRQLEQKPEAKVERVEVPALTDKDRALLKDASSALKESMPVFLKLLQSGGKADVSPDSRKPATTAKHEPSPQAASQSQNGHLSRGERKLLIAITQNQSGVTRDQLSVLVGYKRSSRDTYLQRLSGSGLVYDRADGRIGATDTGIAALGKDYEPLPTGAALIEHWLARLPQGEKRIFQILVLSPRSEHSRDYISEATGYKRSSRDTYIQRLVSRKLVVSAPGGYVSAARELFE